MSKEEIYRRLARMYKWSFHDIARMTPEQQMVAMGGNVDDIIYFDTTEQYERWLKSKKKL